jgi:hypothetical protein
MNKLNSEAISLSIPMPIVVKLRDIFYKRLSIKDSSCNFLSEGLDTIQIILIEI